MKYSIDCSHITVEQVEECNQIKHELGVQIDIRNAFDAKDPALQKLLVFSKAMPEDKFHLWNGDYLHIVFPITIVEE